MARKQRERWLAILSSLLSEGDPSRLYDGKLLAVMALSLATIADALHEMGEPLPCPRGPAFDTDALEGE